MYLGPGALPYEIRLGAGPRPLASAPSICHAGRHPEAPSSSHRLTISPGRLSNGNSGWCRLWPSPKTGRRAVEEWSSQMEVRSGQPHSRILTAMIEMARTRALRFDITDPHGNQDPGFFRYGSNRYGSASQKLGTILEHNSITGARCSSFINPKSFQAPLESLSGTSLLAPASNCTETPARIAHWVRFHADQRFDDSREALRRKVALVFALRRAIAWSLEPQPSPFRRSFSA